MPDVLTMDCRHVPLPMTLTGWRHYAAGDWDTIWQTIAGQGERLTINCPASKNKHLEAIVELNTARFDAEITITGGDSSPPVTPEKLIEMNAGRYSMLLHGLGVKYTAPSQRVITIIVDGPVDHEAPSDRLAYIVEKLWDFQLLAVRVLSDIFRVSDTAPKATAADA